MRRGEKLSRLDNQGFEEKEDELELDEQELQEEELDGEVDDEQEDELENEADPSHSSNSIFEILAVTEPFSSISATSP